MLEDSILIFAALQTVLWLNLKVPFPALEMFLTDLKGSTMKVLAVAPPTVRHRLINSGGLYRKPCEQSAS
ncbi:hypothetical protein O9992_15095 [Vibrio lentus]|nr:hypothetical protein [Vibrio lentus]